MANRLLRRVRDFASVKGHGPVTAEVVAEALAMHRVDALGLDASDRRLLELLLGSYAGGPAGLDTLAAALGKTPTPWRGSWNHFCYNSAFCSAPQGGE